MQRFGRRRSFSKEIRALEGFFSSKEELCWFLSHPGWLGGGCPVGISCFLGKELGISADSLWEGRGWGNGWFQQSTGVKCFKLGLGWSVLSKIKLNPGIFVKEINGMQRDVSAQAWPKLLCLLLSQVLAKIKKM